MKLLKNIMFGFGIVVSVFSTGMIVSALYSVIFNNETCNGFCPAYFGFVSTLLIVGLVLSVGAYRLDHRLKAMNSVPNLKRPHPLFIILLIIFGLAVYLIHGHVLNF